MNAATVAPPIPAGQAPSVPRRRRTGRPLRFVGPSIHDPRLRISVVIGTLHVLGQTVLGFKVSIAQILVTVVLCALIEVAVALVREHVVIWPASGLLTGSSIAFILRASGTRHGDWWSLHGVQFFVLAAVLSLLSKNLLRPDGRHRFNPSNVGIVATLLLIGPARVFPQYLWWGPAHAPVLAALAVIVLGAVWVLKPFKLYGLALSFLVTFAAAVGLFALLGSSFVAIWHGGPVSGASYWLDLAVSPEVLVFAFFMLPDPRTTPASPRGRLVFGALTAALAAGLLVVQPTEFGIKVAILSSLTFMCALAPALDRLAVAGRAALAGGWTAIRSALLRPVTAAILVVALGAPIDTAALAHNTQVLLIERGLNGSHNPQ